MFVAIPHLDLLFVAAYPTSFFTSPTEFAATAIVHGARLFAANCAACHGAEGRGDGPAAQSLPLRPADLTAEHFWAHSDGELYWYISHGFAAPDGSTAMPGFAGMLSSEAIWDLIDYLRAHNAGETCGETGRWPHPLPMPQFDAQCPDGRTIDLDDLRGRVLRIIAVSDEDSPRLPCPRMLDAATILVARHAGKADRRCCVASERQTWTALAIILGCRRTTCPARRSWSIATPCCAKRGDRAIPATGPTLGSSPHACATFPPIRLPSATRSARPPPLMVSSTALLAVSAARRLPFFYGWVVLGCVCLAGFARQGAGGGHAVDLRRADDRGVRLVAHRDRGRGVAGRRPGGLRRRRCSDRCSIAAARG